MTIETTIQRGDGIFPELINRAAFIDKITLNLNGVMRKRVANWICGEGSIPIGGAGRFYARCLRRRNLVSGNPFQLKYGLLKRFQNLSPAVLTIWAGNDPVTCADALMDAGAMMRRGCIATVGSVELTFDITGTPWRVARELCARAETRELQDRTGRTTVYVGGPSSALQVRIYEKVPSVVRVEFVLRSPWLRAQGVCRPEDVLLLRTVDLWKHLSFREVHTSNGAELPHRVREPWTKLGHGLPPQMPAAIIYRELRNAGLTPNKWLIQSERGQLLQRMQSRFIF